MASALGKRAYPALPVHDKSVLARYLAMHGTSPGEVTSAELEELLAQRTGRLAARGRHAKTALLEQLQEAHSRPPSVTRAPRSGSAADVCAARAEEAARAAADRAQLEQTNEDLRRELAAAKARVEALSKYELPETMTAEEAAAAWQETETARQRALTAHVNTPGSAAWRPPRRPAAGLPSRWRV